MERKNEENDVDGSNKCDDSPGNMRKKYDRRKKKKGIRQHERKEFSTKKKNEKKRKLAIKRVSTE